MADVVKFVSTLSTTPTVLLDLNGESANGWYCRVFKAPAPRMRRSVSSNAMRDGVHVSSSQYDGRTLVLDLENLKDNQDDAAAEFQKLAREMDRENNWLMYQPQGATKPVFFRLFRSDLADIEDVLAQKAMRRFTVELPAEPFALGARETMSAATINQDPAAGTNPCSLDLGTVIGDVPTPAVIVAGTQADQILLASRHNQITTDTPRFEQCESMTLGTDTTNPGGGPDAALSGTGANNFVRTTFATATMATRVTWVDAVTSGRFRVIAAVRRSDNTSEINVRAKTATETGPTVATRLTTSRQVLDLGVVSGHTAMTYVGYASAANSETPADWLDLLLEASRPSGAGTLDWDVVMLFPADEQYCAASTSPTAVRPVIDGVKDEIWAWDGIGDPLLGTGSGRAIDFVRAGSLPMLHPGYKNHLFLALNSLVTAGVSVTVHYWPRYLFVRPSAS